MPDFHPERSLAIIFGASSFPRWPQLLQGRFFYDSAADVRDYLNDPRGLAIPDQNLLWLFDDSQSPTDQVNAMDSFLENQTRLIESKGVKVEDLFIYYVGHGSFTPDRAYCLAVRSSTTSVLGIRASEFAYVVKQKAGFCRRYLILDCCFAAGAAREFQSSPLGVAREQLEQVLPGRGTTLLCAASADDPARTPQGSSRTMFCSALMRALREGHPNAGERLSISELGILIQKHVRDQAPNDFVRPEVHSPDQREGDVATIPLFPNPAYRQPQLPPKPQPSAQPAKPSLKPVVTPAVETAPPQAQPKDKPRPPQKISAPIETERPTPAARVAPERPQPSRESAAKSVDDSVEEVERKRRSQEAAADRILEAAKQRKLAEAKKRAREKAATPVGASAPRRPAPQTQTPALKSFEPAPAKTTPRDILLISAVALAINGGGYFSGKFWAWLISGYSIFGVHNLAAVWFVSIAFGLFLGGLYNIFAGSDADVRRGSLVLWPGFLLGFYLYSAPSPEAQPTLWIGVAIIAVYLYVAIFSKPIGTS